MKFRIEFADIDRRGIVNAELTTLTIMDDKTKLDVPVIRYIIQFLTGDVVLHKTIKSNEWFPTAVNARVPQFMITKSINAIEKFEKEKKPQYSLLSID